MATEAASQNPLSARKAVDAARSMIPPDVRTQATPVAGQARTYRSHIAKSKAEAGDDLLDLEANDIVIQPRLANIVLFDGLVNNQRMIVFVSPLGRDMIRDYGDNVGIDGTFKVIKYKFCRI